LSYPGASGSEISRKTSQQGWLEPVENEQVSPFFSFQENIFRKIFDKLDSDLPKYDFGSKWVIVEESGSCWLMLE
jgi:hypothetical protein